MRTRADFETLGGGYQWRSYTPSQAREIAKARRSGIPAQVLAREYHVSTRTIYRAAASAAAPHAIGRVDGWWAEFVIGDEGPIRITPWNAALSPEEVERFRVTP